MAAKKKGKKSAGKKRSAARKAPARRKMAKAAPKKKRSVAKRKPNLAFMKPMTPSSTLAAVVGGSPIPRTEVTKKLWAYIKRNGLQDSVNRRMINADDNLRQVFGGRRQVSMFEMTKLVNAHLR
jgi:chromatin remodeling complex protein RSC6